MISNAYMCKSGIYQIRNLDNGKIYIGKAVNLKRRKSQHFHSLSKGTHPNKYMQNAFASNQRLVFYVVEFCDRSLLEHREQQYLDVLWDNQTMCYNIRATVDCVHTTGKTYNVEIVSPKGEVYGPIVNLSAFARSHSLVEENLSALISGKLKSTRGWILKDGLSKRPERKTRGSFVSPEGERFENVGNLAEFAEKFGLHGGGFGRLLNNQRKTYKGWRLL